jgi:hypothetical protein
MQITGMRLSFATEPAPGHVNEDYAVCGNGWAVVLDGATAPPGVNSGCIHDVPWLVRHLAAAVARHLVLNPGPLPDLLSASIKETCAAHASTCDLDNPDSPSSTISIVRLCEGTCEYLALADSPIVIRGTDGILTPVIDDRTAHLPGGRPYTAELVRSHRNRPGGFWVASTDPDAASHALTGTMPAEAVQDIGLFSDGASRLVELYGCSWNQVFSVLDADGPARVITLVRAAERETPPAHGKQHDDATAIYWHAHSSGSG